MSLPLLDFLQRDRVHREYVFYRNLCEELLRWATDESFKVHMSVRKQQEAQQFWGRFDEIGGLEDDDLALREMKQLTGAVTRFYSKRIPLRYANTPDAAEHNYRLHLKNWRWEHMLARARKWVEFAKQHDWSHDLQMQPQWAQQEARTI